MSCSPSYPSLADIPTFVAAAAITPAGTAAAPPVKTEITPKRHITPLAAALFVMKSPTFFFPSAYFSTAGCITSRLALSLASLSLAVNSLAMASGEGETGTDMEAFKNTSSAITFTSSVITIWVPSPSPTWTVISAPSTWSSSTGFPSSPDGSPIENVPPASSTTSIPWMDAFPFRPKWTQVSIPRSAAALAESGVSCKTAPSTLENDLQSGFCA